MKICFLSSGSSIHTIRWVNAMVERGHEVYLVTMHLMEQELNNIDGRVNIYKLKFSAPLGYYLNKFEVKKLLKKIRPDIVNTHYASGYGTLSRLSGFKPTLLSVWGSDVFDFPYESTKKEKILRKNLYSATQIASTSWIMKEQTEKFVNPVSPIKVTPFGVDMGIFCKLDNEKSDELITIGTVKKLEEKYGIRYLIEATSLLVNKLKETHNDHLAKKIQLLIVGDGEQLKEMQQLTRKLKVDHFTTFTGAVPHHEVPKYLNRLDIYCAPSTLDSESFGVAIVEASACEIPVIVSNVGGLPEVVRNGETGYIVNNKSSYEISEKLFELVLNKYIREKMGKRGREFVSTIYSWNENVEKMEKVYYNLAKGISIIE